MSGLTPEQLRIRRGRISASDVGAILGLNPSRGPWSVYAEKHGLATVEETPIMALGTLVEPLVRACAPMPITDSPGTLTFEDWAACTPDGLVGDDAGAEIKLSVFGDGAWGREDTDEVPRHYVTQCNWSMHWTGRRRWHLFRLRLGMDVGNLAAWMLKNGRDPLPLIRDALDSRHGAAIQTYTLDYHEGLARTVVERCRSWWERYVAGDGMPEPNDEEVCAQAIATMRSDIDAGRAARKVPLTDDVVGAMRTARDAWRQGTAAESAQVNAGNTLRALFLDGREEIHAPGVGRATFRARKDGVRVLRVDWEETT